MPRELFVSKLQYFHSFKYISSITQAKQIINLLLLNNFYPVIYDIRVQKESDELLYIYGLVTLYGPQSVASASG